MSKITPLHRKRSEYRCLCDGPVFSKQLNYNDVHWLCGSCGEECVTDITEYPSHFVVRADEQ